MKIVKKFLQYFNRPTLKRFKKVADEIETSFQKRSKKKLNFNKDQKALLKIFKNILDFSTPEFQKKMCVTELIKVLERSEDILNVSNTFCFLVLKDIYNKFYQKDDAIIILYKKLYGLWNRAKFAKAKIKSSDPKKYDKEIKEIIEGANIFYEKAEKDLVKLLEELKEISIDDLDYDFKRLMIKISPIITYGKYIKKDPS